MKKTSSPLRMGYRLGVSSVIDAPGQKTKTRFVLETSESFASFIYDLSVREQREGSHLRFKVLGLKPPQLSIPSSGHARFERDYEDLDGTFEVTIERMDGSTNTFRLRSSPTTIKLLRAPKEAFTELIL